MSAEHIYTYDDPPSERHIALAIQALERGEVIAYQTDLNWAFGCDASSSKALDRVRFLKPYHPKEQPFSLICSDISMASTVANIDNSAYRYLKKAWPGPYTILLERNRNLPKAIKDKRRVVGIRIPDNNLLRTLVERYSAPMATTSVPKLPNGAIPRFGYEIEENFGHALSIILDLGHEVSGQESTIIDMTSGAPELIRKGVGETDIFDIAN